MGRIKSAMVKRAAKELVEQEVQFTEDFDHNKRLLDHTMPSKKIRNKVAGYLARLEKAKQKN